ncbi:alpha/beta fold hydrolase [Gammaproteobacteria bacterium]|jgi:uncharacterized protein|nr:alpha/beta fold hydrolase [Gammaproteobacteria bacterium]
MKIFLSLLLISPLILSSEISLDKKAITFWSGASRLSGDIYKPSNLADDQLVPAILLIPGWGGNKENLNKSFAPQFAKLGYVVMTFDFRGWGESDGFFLPNQSMPVTLNDQNIDVQGKQKRLIVNPEMMIEDARAALSWLAGEAHVQSNNIGLWGTSFGGGIALVTAANDPRVQALISQMGTVNSKANFDMIPDSMVSGWETQRARGVIPPYPGKESALPGLEGYPDLIALKKYDPASYWSKVSIPTLIIDASQEELFDIKKNGEKLHHFLKNKVETKYIPIEGTHYDLYKGEGYKKALFEAEQWFFLHLK